MVKRISDSIRTIFLVTFEIRVVDTETTAAAATVLDKVMCF